MAQSVASVCLLVRDYDPAIQFFTQAMGFKLLEDTPLSPTKRWVRVGPGSNQGATLLLARAVNRSQRSQIGRQSGGRVFLFLQTTRFWSDYRRMKAAGVRFTEEPRHEPYGWVVVFQDLYGNRWDLLQMRNPRRDVRPTPRAL